MRVRTVASALIAGALALPAAGSAQGVLPPPQPAPQPAPAPTPAPAPSPAPAPAAAKLHLSVEKAGRTRSVLEGRRFRVRGTVVPYVAGQKVTVRFQRGSRKLRVRSVSLQRSKTGKSGSFVIGYASRRTGSITVRASHAATATQSTAVAKPIVVRVLPRRLRQGASGASVRQLQSALSRLGYVVGRRGRFDARTARAVLAYRKMTGLSRTSSADAKVFSKLAAGAGAFKVRFPRDGRHVEGDLTHQVLALIGSGGKVEHLYTMSSGKASTPTVLGHFRVYRKDPGTNSEGMVNSSYFIRGYAVHGYAEVPTYNASHGCMRVPIPDSLAIFDWIRLGTPVDVYYR